MASQESGSDDDLAIYQAARARQDRALALCDRYLATRPPPAPAPLPNGIAEDLAELAAANKAVDEALRRLLGGR